MESVLHIEPLNREITEPLSIGHTEYIFFGEKPLENEDDPMGTPASYTRLGCPLWSVDSRDTPTTIPMMKTFEYMPDFSSRNRNIYLETLHYLKDRSYLIPIRTKIHSGLSQGLILTHIPSLNLIRQDITGDRFDIEDIRPHVISDLIAHDSTFEKHKKHPIMDWIRDDLTNTLSRTTTVDVVFDPEHVQNMIAKFSKEVVRSPYELTKRNLRDVITSISYGSELGLDSVTVPMAYSSEDVIAHPVIDAKLRMVAHNFDFRSKGKLPLHRIPRLDKNPPGFLPILGVIDRLPLTDFNIDIVLDSFDNIAFYHENIAINRLTVFSDNELGSFNSSSLLSDLVNSYTLRTILKGFLKYHSSIDEELEHTLRKEPVKFKIIKTISDEILILLYSAHSKADDHPLCGVYFDAAIQSLAPLVLIQKPIEG